jgi:hypothetical protein
VVLALAGIVGAGGDGDDDNGNPRHGCGSQRCQAEHDAAGRGAGGAAVITSVRYQVQVWRLPFAMRYRGACETLAHVLEALDYSRRHTRSVLRPLIAARPPSAPMRMQLRNQREIMKCGR